MCACACGAGARCDEGACCPNDQCRQCRELQEYREAREQTERIDKALDTISANATDNPLGKDPRRI